MSRLLRMLGSEVDRRWTSIAHRLTPAAQVLGLRPVNLTLRAATVWRDINEPFVEFPAARLGRFALYFDFDIELDLPWDESGRYEHSRLYLADGESDFDAVTFRIPKLREAQHIRILLPPTTRRAKKLRLRLNPLPISKAGRYRVISARLMLAEDGDIEASRSASLQALKEFTRKSVVSAEEDQAGVCQHYPGWLSLELTAKCNLTCTHCSSHGTTEVHRQSNRMKEFSPDDLTALATEVFPSLTAVTLVGRGEPTMVSEELWNALLESLARYGVLLSVVTNGHFIKRRITPQTIPLIETLMFSIDGITSQTFAANRGGANLERMWEAVEYFDQLRRAANLARRPRLAFSWTLKRNNIHEFPEFIRQILRFDPDLVYARHLLMFFEKERSQSLLGEARLVNRYLSEAYEMLAAHGIRTDCPPLMEAALPNSGPIGSASSPNPVPKRDGCMFIHRSAVMSADGEVATCSKPFATIAGRFGDGGSFRQIWNGSVMHGVRSSLNTDAEWSQCQNCWYRESRYQSQRARVDLNQERYDLRKVSSHGHPGTSWRIDRRDRPRRPGYRRTNRKIRSQTFFGCSCTQCPAPSTSPKPRISVQALVRIACRTPGVWQTPPVACA